jgi:hypothetical protein
VEIASGVAAKTLLQIVAASNHRALVKSWGVFGKGVTSTDAPIKVRLLRQSTAGTMSALTPVKCNSADDETLQTTAQHTATAEPTAGDVLATIEVHPQSGYVEHFPFGSEIVVPGGGRLGIDVLAGATVSMTAFIEFEE